MKKYLTAILFLLMFTAPAKAQAPWDLIYHAMPISVGFDIPEEISQISGNLQSTVSQAKKIIMTFKTDASNLQSAIMSTFNKIKSGAILDILGNPGQAEAGFCGKDVKKTKAKVIAKKVKEVLLIAKSDDFSYIGEQKRQKERFFMDNVYAIHAASLILQQEVENDIKAQIDKAKTCAGGQGGECGIPSTDEGGNNETIFAYGKTLEAMDSVVRLWESVAALKARLTAIKMINKITPAIDAKSVREDSGKQASLKTPFAISKTHKNVKMAFAQLDLKGIVSKITKNKTDKMEAASAVQKESETLQYIKNTVDFVSPDMNEKENALAAVQNEMNALGEMNEVETLVSNAMDTHNLIRDLPQYRDRALQYLEMQEDYKKAFERLVTSEKCAINYLGAYFTKPHMVWSGNLPLANANKHDLRKGISGWAFNAFEILKSGEATDVINAYEVAQERTTSEEAAAEDTAYLTNENALKEKIENTMKGSNTKPDEIAQDSLTPEEMSETSDDPCMYLDMDGADAEDCKSKGSEPKKKRFSEESSNKTTDEAVSASKKQGANEEARKAAMLYWQVGAEASKLLGTPENNSLWGSPSTGKKLVWNDTKRFYKKYLEMKYENVKKYMMSYSEADVLELIAKKLSGESQKATDSQYQQARKNTLMDLAGKAKEKLQGIFNEKKAARDNLASSVASIEKEKAEIEADIDELNNELRTIKEEINTIKSVKEEEKMKAMEKSLASPVDYYPTDDDGNPLELDLSGKKVENIDRTKLSSNVIDGVKSNLTDDVDIKEKEEKIISLQKNIGELVAKQTALETQIKVLKLQTQEGRAPADDSTTSASAEEELLNAINGGDGSGGALAELQAGAKGDALSTIRSVLEASNAENPIEGFNIDSAMNGISKGATNVVIAAQEKAMEIVTQEGLKKLYALGDDLYSESSYPQIEKIHNDMISKLKAVSFSFSVIEKTIAPLISAKDLFVFAEFLEGVDTSSENEGFFVGSTPKERDLKAPFRLSGYDLPPVREVFHFDAADFKNVQPEQQPTSNVGDWLEKMLEKLGPKKRFIEKEDFLNIEKEEFLNYGGEIPKIWKKMLEDYPFIESRLPLNEILSGDGDCEDKSFARGGVMPCLYENGKKIMDIEFIEIGLIVETDYLWADFGGSDKPLGPCSSIITKGEKPYHTFWKINLANGLQKRGYKPEFCEYSELGMLFEADKHNNLFLRKNVFKNFNRINRRDGKDINKMIPAAKRNLAAARHAELSRNQIGDFLKQAEGEKSAKENLEEAKAEYENSMVTVYDLFKEYGFTPSANFNLANKDDYKQAEKTLKNLKKQRLDKAEQALKSISVENNAPAQEKNRNLLKLIKFMRTDIESVLKLSMADADSNDLALRLAKEIVNEKVLGAFKKKNEEEKENFGDIEEAYCAIY